VSSGVSNVIPSRLQSAWAWVATPDAALSEEAYERAQLTLRVLRLLTSTLVCVAWLALHEERNQRVWIAGLYLPTAALFLGLIACAKRGYSTFAAWVLAWAVWTFVTVVVFYFGGLASSCAVIYAIVVMLAGATLGRRGGMVLALASIGISALALHAQVYAWLPEPRGPILPFNTFTALAVTVLLTAIFHDMALASTRRALRATSTTLARLRSAEAENETRAMQGAALGRLGERALSARAASELLRDAVETLSEFLPAERGLLLLDEREGQFRLGQSAARTPPERTLISDPRAAGLSRALREHLCVQQPEERAELERQLGLPPSATALAVMVPGRLAPHGVLIAMRDVAAPFTAEQRQFAVTIANMIGHALERENTESLAMRAQKMEAVARLAGGVAHDFNNLLTVMIASTAELRDQPLDAAGLHALGDLETATQGAVLLSRQLLALGRRQPRPAQAIDLGALVDDLLAMMRRLVGKNVQLIDKVERGPHVTVLGDRAGLEQALLNLVVNAQQAMPHGGRLEVCVRPLPEFRVELSVRDTGVGMDDATRAKIFQSFFTTKPDGTGLGLATVADVIERHAGKITVRSAPGEGSTFTLDLPRLGASAAQNKLVPLPDSAILTQLTPTPKAAAARILLVDDHDLVRQIATRTLHSLGYEVLAKPSAQDALEALENPRQFALLITDVNMPGLPGTAIVEALERRGSDLPVLYISGFIDPTTKRGAADAQRGRRVHFLAKPFLPEQLAAAVTTCLERSSQN